MVRRVEGARLLSSLLLFALLAADVAPLSWDLPEPRNRAGKIRVHPRGNLWATGHFMGKKSLEPPSPSPLGTAPHTSLRDQRLQLSHDLLRILLLKKALSVSLSHPRTPHPGGCWYKYCRNDTNNGTDTTAWLRLCPPREGAEWDPGDGPIWM
ncbi:neuromedin-B isoform X2 [Rhinopithecus roxellana]|uniref:neuromedin-B isoform X2 n=1 Tax=Rhinopithecus roxellana TaxID=61622 RepID=UPI001237844C|nr:neuromedin-B isoform X2 [Rhinopithecus roxellana]